MTNHVPPTFKKGDLRRMLLVLASIEKLTSATLVQIVRMSGLDKKTVIYLIDQAREEAGVTINKDGPVYSIAAWGNVIRKSGALMILKQSSSQD
jgi:hypothetical protein